MFDLLYTKAIGKESLGVHVLMVAGLQGAPQNSQPYVKI